MGRDYLTPQLINHVVFSSATPPRLTNTVNPVLIIQLAVCLLGGPLTSSVRIPSTSPCSFLFKNYDKQTNEGLIYNTSILVGGSKWWWGVIDVLKADLQAGKVLSNLWRVNCWTKTLFHRNLKGNTWSQSRLALRSSSTMLQCFCFIRVNREGEFFG